LTPPVSVENIVTQAATF